jgi:hypothetical protein
MLLLAVSAAEPPQVEAIDYALPQPGQTPGGPITGCRAANANEILVCGRRSDKYRIEELKPPPGTEAPPSDGTFGIGLAKGVRAEVEQVTRPDGYRDTRVLIKLKIPF